MADPNLVVKIDTKYFESRIGIAMIMSFIVFKRPLEPEQIGESLNQQILGALEPPVEAEAVIQIGKEEESKQEKN